MSNSYNYEPQESAKYTISSASTIKYFKNLRVVPGNKKSIILDEQVKIHDNMTVKELKTIIVDKAGLGSSIDEVKFLNGPNILSSSLDNKKLKEAKIEDGSSIFIVFRVRGGADDINIKVECVDGTSVTIKISKERSINTLKQRVAAKNGILQDKHMSLQHIDTILDND